MIRRALLQLGKQHELITCWSSSKETNDWTWNVDYWYWMRDKPQAALFTQSSRQNLDFFLPLLLKHNYSHQNRLFVISCILHALPSYSIYLKSKSPKQTTLDEKKCSDCWASLMSCCQTSSTRLHSLKTELYPEKMILWTFPAFHIGFTSHCAMNGHKRPGQSIFTNNTTEI